MINFSYLNEIIWRNIPNTRKNADIIPAIDAFDFSTSLKKFVNALLLYIIIKKYKIIGNHQIGRELKN